MFDAENCSCPNIVAVDPVVPENEVRPAPIIHRTTFLTRVEFGANHPELVWHESPAFTVFRETECNYRVVRMSVRGIIKGNIGS
jgi:hypothetical protein